MADNPPAATTTAEAGHAISVTINDMMGRTVTDEMFGEILQGSIVWEDQEDMIPLAEEATSLDPEPATPGHHDAQDEGDHDAD